MKNITIKKKIEQIDKIVKAALLISSLNAGLFIGAIIGLLAAS